VLGNHDLHLLAVHYVDGNRTRKGDTLDGILAAPDRELLLGWLRAQPLLHVDAEFNCALVHAGIAPEWDLAQAQQLAAEVETALRGPGFRDYLAAMYGNAPERWSPGLDAVARRRFTTNCLTRMRYVTDDGRLEMRVKGGLEKQRPGLVPWFMAPGRRTLGTRILFGHWSTLRLTPAQENHYGVHALDTGAVWGGTLSALRLDDGVRIEVPGLGVALPVTGPG
jgi:bis(5'-nucleosyl)-tetraphosphatase (symmetrical)